jgi:hypothetical protein
MAEDVSGRLMEWIDEHYKMGEATGGKAPMLVCRRCEQPVGYVTKHAVERHGDDIQVMPAVNSVAREMVSIW